MGALTDTLRGVVLKGAGLRFRTGPEAAWQGLGNAAVTVPATTVQVEITRPEPHR